MRPADLTFGGFFFFFSRPSWSLVHPRIGWGDSYGLTPLYHTAVNGATPAAVSCCSTHAAVSCKDENGWAALNPPGARAALTNSQWAGLGCWTRPPSP